VQTYVAGGEQAYQAQNGGAESMGALPFPVF
jgi:glutaconate CoA-transferase subunit A